MRPAGTCPTRSASRKRNCGGSPPSCRTLVKAKGHDGIVVWRDDSAPGDIRTNGENINIFRNLFDYPQVILCRERTPMAPAAEAPNHASETIRIGVYRHPGAASAGAGTAL